MKEDLRGWKEYPVLLCTLGTWITVCSWNMYHTSAHAYFVHLEHESYVSPLLLCTLGTCIIALSWKHCWMHLTYDVWDVFRNCYGNGEVWERTLLQLFTYLTHLSLRLGTLDVIQLISALDVLTRMRTECNLLISAFSGELLELVFIKLCFDNTYLGIVSL